MMAETQEDQMKLGITYSLDKDRFFRRMCPSCGREFKTKVEDINITSLIQPVIRHVGTEIGEDLTIESEDKEIDDQYFYCPYCQFYGLASEMITDNLFNYLKHMIMREYVLPMIDKTLNDFSKELSKMNRSSSNDFFRININTSHERSIKPPLPIHGPELPDMKLIKLLCCRNEIKISRKWDHMERCPYCGCEVKVQ